MRRQSQIAEIAQPPVVGRPNRGDGPAQGLCVLLGEFVDVKRCGPGQFVDRADVGPGTVSTAVITSATSLEATGEVRPPPNGNASWPVARIERAASMSKSGFSSRTVGRMCTAGTPDQLMTCSASQCRRCCLDSSVLVAVIWETVICDMLTKTSRPPSSSAATHTTVVACR